ncbi:MAG: tyrosine-type recombinase/integrase [Candidatus Binataceae bacterium]
MYRNRQFRREPLRPDDIAKLRATASSITNRAIVETLLSTGVRIHEFIQFTPDDLDTTHNTIVVKKGKGGVRRQVYISNDAAAALTKLWSRDGAGKLTARKCQYRLAKLQARARIERNCSPHRLRHTFAVQTLTSGVSIETVRQMLGHSSLQMTALYLNLAPDRALDEMRTKLKPAARPEPRVHRGNQTKRPAPTA